MRTTSSLPARETQRSLPQSREVIRVNGGMAAVNGPEITVLPLDCAGLMSTLSARDVVARLDALRGATGKMGGIAEPLMYLSFLALTVIPGATDHGSRSL